MSYYRIGLEGDKTPREKGGGPLLVGGVILGGLFLTYGIPMILQTRHRTK